MLRSLKCLIFFGILFLNGNRLLANTNYDSLFLNGDSLYRLSCYNDAAVCYEYVMYQYQERHDIVAEACIRKANIYIQENQLQLALETLKRLKIDSISSDQRYRLFYKYALIFYLDGDLNLADYYLGKVIGKSTFEKSAEFQLLTVLVFNGNQHWEEARKYARNLVFASVVDSIEREFMLTAINKMYTQASSHRKRERLAIGMSAVIPGLGQAYASKPYDALVSFGLCGISLAGAVFFLREGLIISSFLGGLGLFQRFYYGGLTHTRSLVRVSNNNNIKRLNFELSKLFSQLGH